jgi:hypothetical protein
VFVYLCCCARSWAVDFFQQNIFGPPFSLNLPSLLMPFVAWWDRVLTTTEMMQIATTYTSPVFQSGTFPLYLQPPPLSCPQSSSTQVPLNVIIPHFYGGSIWLNITSDPPGFVTPSVLYWNTALSGSAQQAVQNFSFSCSNAVSVMKFHLQLSNASDLVHYYIGPRTPAGSSTCTRALQVRMR